MSQNKDLQPPQISYRDASENDLHELKAFVIEHGTTRWSHFPIDDLERHIDDLKRGVAQGIIAQHMSRIIGMVTFSVGEFYSEYEDDRSGQRITGYIVEILVDPDCRGQQIGTHLVEQANSALLASGVQTIYAKRHEEKCSISSTVTEKWISNYRSVLGSI